MVANPLDVLLCDGLLADLQLAPSPTPSRLTGGLRASSTATLAVSASLLLPNAARLFWA